MPCDDRAATDLLRFFDWALDTPDALPIVELIKKSLGDPGSYAVIYQRSALIEAATEEGIRAPRTCVVASLRQLADVGREYGYPIVLKLDGTWGGEGVLIAGDEADAKKKYAALAKTPSLTGALLRAAARRDAHFLRYAVTRRPRTINVQEYVDGRPANSAFASWKGEICAAVHADVVKEARVRGPATVIAPVERAEMDRAAKRLARRFNLSGFHGLDYVLQTATNTPYLVEMNPRPVPTSHLALGKDRDLAAAIVSRIAGVPQPARAAITSEAPYRAVSPRVATGCAQRIPRRGLS